MMLDANTLQWLEDRDALQFMFDQYTLPDGEVSFDDDYADEAEFEERVAMEIEVLKDVTMTAFDMVKYARLEVEWQMIREGKWPGLPEEAE